MASASACNAPACPNRVRIDCIPAADDELGDLAPHSATAATVPVILVAAAEVNCATGHNVTGMASGRKRSGRMVADDAIERLFVQERGRTCN